MNSLTGVGNLKGKCNCPKCGRHGRVNTKKEIPCSCIKYGANIPCERCNGTKVRITYGTVTCDKCNGTGLIDNY